MKLFLHKTLAPFGFCFLAAMLVCGKMAAQNQYRLKTVVPFLNAKITDIDSKNGKIFTTDEYFRLKVFSDSVTLTRSMNIWNFNFFVDLARVDDFIYGSILASDKESMIQIAKLKGRHTTYN